METPAAYHRIGVDEIDDRNDLMPDFFKFLGTRVAPAILALAIAVGAAFYFS